MPVNATRRNHGSRDGRRVIPAGDQLRSPSVVWENRNAPLIGQERVNGTDRSTALTTGWGVAVASLINGATIHHVSGALVTKRHSTRREALESPGTNGKPERDS